MAGYGGNWGGAPWGGADFDGTAFDVFCFDDCESLPNLVSSPLSTVLGEGQQFQNYYPPGGDTCDLGLLSGQLSDGTFSTKTAVLQVTPATGIPNKWTFEWTLKLHSMPTNFGDLVNSHVYVGASNNEGPVGGLFISSAGIAYAGDILHTGPNNDLVLNGPVQPIPDSASRVALDTYITYRISSDGDTGVAYIYVTPTLDLPSVGHQLLAVMPALSVAGLVYPVTDKVIYSVKGTTAKPSVVSISQCCLAASSIVPNLAPIADAGPDQAARACSILRLDGSASVDPEGVGLSYQWRLIDAPSPSAFAVTAFDGTTVPLPSPTGFTDKFHSATFGEQDAVDPFAIGDVLTAYGASYSITGTGADVDGFYVQLGGQYLPDSSAGVGCKLLRQRGLSNPDQVRATFLPDVLGFYRFDLLVNDGVLLSEPSVCVANVVESVLPRGITPDLSFMFTYLSDFWNLVEGKERLEVYWGALAQIAATELLTLWQIEYSKSLRDVQRTFIRRWLHYDLLLGEPLPDFTTTRFVYSGTSSSVIPAAGTAVAGTLSISIPHQDRTVDVTVLTMGTVMAAAFGDELRRRLGRVDARFTVEVIARRDGDFIVRILAPFAYTILSSTSPVFSGSAGNVLLQGVGVRLGPRGYLTDVSLKGLGIQENDVVVIDGKGYLVSSVVDDPTDMQPFQRLTLKSDLPLVVSGSWQIGSTVRSQLLDFYRGLVTGGDYVFFEVADVASAAASQVLRYELLTAPVLCAVEDDGGLLCFDASALETAVGNADLSIYLAKVLRRSYVPVDAQVLEVPTLVEHIQMQDDTATLLFNLDFFREEYRGIPCLRFMSGTPDVWEGQHPPDRLWAEYSYLDNRERIEGYFGIPAEFTLDELAQLPGNVDYLAAVQGLWFAYFGGPTLRNLRVGSQILLGLPFAEERGVIEEIREDYSPTQGRMLIRDQDHAEIVRSYNYVNGLALEVNPDTGKAYAVGDTVQQFAPLVQGVEIVDWVKDPKWIQGFVNQGVLYEVEKFHRFLVRIDSAAFNLAALLFAQRFVLRIKPRYSYPLFIVRERLKPTEIDVVTELHTKVTLRFVDGICMPYSSHVYDDARAGGGGYWNQFDNNQGDPIPLIPTPYVTTNWGYDRYVLCPGTHVTLGLCTQFPGGTPQYDSVWAYDQPIDQRVAYLDSGPFSIPSGSGGITLTPSGSDVVVLSGGLARVSILINGGLGADPNDYELVLVVNGVEQAAIPLTLGPTFTESDFTLIFLSITVPVAASDTVGLWLRHGGGSTRTPTWTSIAAYVDIESRQWTFDDTLPAARYCGRREIQDATT